MSGDVDLSRTAGQALVAVFRLRQLGAANWDERLIDLLDRLWLDAFYYSGQEIREDWQDEFMDEMRRHWRKPEYEPQMLSIAEMEWNRMRSRLQIQDAKEAARAAVINIGAIEKDGSLTIEHWYWEGQLHREGEPAVVAEDGDYHVREYWRHGKRHRAQDLGPAVEIQASTYSYRAYYEDGLLERADGPAVEYFGEDQVFTSYCRHGLFHRDPNDGPAFARYSDEEILLEYSVWGDLHRDSADGEAVFHQTPRCIARDYWQHGERHRAASEGPALIVWDQAGLREEYWRYGLRHRDCGEGPAVRSIRRNGCSFEEYHRYGVLDRSDEDAPAATWIYEDGSSSIGYYHAGVYHRPHKLGPALIWFDVNGCRISELYYEHDELHRDPVQGPASISYGSPDGDFPPRRSFYWRGRHLDCPVEGLFLEITGGSEPGTNACDG